MIVLLAVLVLSTVGCASKAEKAQREVSKLVLAQKAYEAGKFPDAEKALEAVLKDAPDDVKALGLMALVQAAQGKNKEAISQYRLILEAKPKDHASWYRMAMLERVIGKSKESQAHLERALSIKPGDRGYTDELARTKMALGAYEEAAALWGGLLKADGVDKEGRKELLLLQGQAYQAAKQYGKAKKAFKAAMKLDPNDKALKERVASF